MDCSAYYSRTGLTDGVHFDEKPEKCTCGRAQAASTQLLKHPKLLSASKLCHFDFYNPLWLASH